MFSKLSMDQEFATKVRICDLFPFTITAFILLHCAKRFPSTLKATEYDTEIFDNGINAHTNASLPNGSEEMRSHRSYCGWTHYFNSSN